MRIPRLRRFVMVGAGIVGLAATISRAADPALTCNVRKMLRAGAYQLCVVKATALAVQRGESMPALARCDAKLMAAWAKAEAQAAGQCPTAGDESAIAAQVRGDVTALVAALTPTSSTTSTTLPSGPPCGTGIYPGCGGSCPAGSTCWATVSPGPTQECRCLASVATPCAATGGPAAAGPICGGACPDGEVCSTLRIDDSTLVGTCGCVPAGSTPCISSGGPACGGTCPSGLGCAADPLGLFSCVCQ